MIWDMEVDEGTGLEEIMMFKDHTIKIRVCIPTTYSRHTHEYTQRTHKKVCDPLKRAMGSILQQVS